MVKNLDLVWAVPGADLSAASGKREIDVLGLSRESVAVADVKTSAGGFSDADVLEAATVATQLKADRLVLATLDDWDSTRKRDVETRATSATSSAVAVIGLRDLAQT
jgi:hypothetical protein